MRPGPLPEEINWKNLELSFTAKKARQSFALVGESVVLMAVLSITAVFAYLEVARDLYLTGISYAAGIIT